MKGRDERVLLSNAAHSKGFDRRLGGGGGRLSRFFYAGKERRRRRSLFFFFKVIIGSLELMFRNVVFSRVVSISKARRFCLSLSRTFEGATREERRSAPDFFVALVRIEPEERRRTTLEERQRCRSCVSTFQSKQTTKN